MNFEDFPTTHLEAVRYFSNDENAHNFLVAIRWPNGIRCAHCDSEHVGNLCVSKTKSRKGTPITRRLWTCKACRKQFTAKVHTIFEDSPLGLDKWLPAVWMLVNAKNGVSSCELARALGVTKKCAWHMGHRIRAAMHNGIFNLAGEVEADETFIGGKARNMHKDKWARFKNTDRAHMTAVAGLLERTTGEKHSQVKLKVVKTTRRRELQANVRANVGKGAFVFTDALLSYEGLSDDYLHQVIDHAIAYVDGKIHTNGLENFWSLLKRTLKGTYVKAETFHLFRYLDEQTTRFNERIDSDLERFLSTLSRVSGRRLPYRKLIGKDDSPESKASAGPVSAA